VHTVKNLVITRYIAGIDRVVCWLNRGLKMEADLPIIDPKADRARQHGLNPATG
jgi:hypothetical protein